MSEAAQKLPDDIANMSFEKAMAELEQIVGALENGQGELEASIKQYERGALLQRHCQQTLEDAKLKVEQIVLTQGKASGVKAFDEESA